VGNAAVEEEAVLQVLSGAERRRGKERLDVLGDLVERGQAE
jgi:hypothetical protein